MTGNNTAPQYTDSDGVTLAIGAVDATTYHDTAPVVALAITHPDGDGDPVLYIGVEHIEDVIAAIRRAASEARELHAAGSAV